MPEPDEGESREALTILAATHVRASAEMLRELGYFNLAGDAEALAQKIEDTRDA